MFTIIVYYTIIVYCSWIFAPFCSQRRRPGISLQRTGAIEEHDAQRMQQQGHREATAAASLERGREAPDAVFSNCIYIYIYLPGISSIYHDIMIYHYNANNSVHHCYHDNLW